MNAISDAEDLVTKDVSPGTVNGVDLIEVGKRCRVSCLLV
jgi:hypothetical protein